jgi:hypothetical protein
MKRTDVNALVCGIVSLALLLGAGADRLRVRPSADAAEYHRRVREAAAKIPMQIADWTGTDVPLAYDAARMLRPNVMLCRDYQHAQTDQHVWFMLIQCDDALALGGHCPTICYPNIGYARLSQEPRTWHSGTVQIDGAEYVFSRDARDPSAALTIANFLLLPDGSSTSDTNALFIAASDLRRRFYGGAEVQIVFDSGTQADQRQAIIQQFLDASHETLVAVASPHTTHPGDSARN